MDADPHGKLNMIIFIDSWTEAVATVECGGTSYLQGRHPF